MDFLKLWANNVWSSEQGQDVAEYSIMLAVVLVIVVGTVRLIGSNSGNVFSNVGSAIQELIRPSQGRDAFPAIVLTGSPPTPMQ
jgi:Flp pilus assembly pilin Flp